MLVTVAFEVWCSSRAEQTAICPVRGYHATGTAKETRGVPAVGSLLVQHVALTTAADWHHDASPAKLDGWGLVLRLSLASHSTEALESVPGNGLSISEMTASSQTPRPTAALESLREFGFRLLGEELDAGSQTSRMRGEEDPMPLSPCMSGLCALSWAAG